MHSLHKSPEMLAYEREAARELAQKENRQRSRELVRSLGGQDYRFPVLPASTLLLLEMCRDNNVSYKQLSQVIQTDPGLAVRILRVANSALYGQSSKVNSITRALTVIGLNEVRSIGLGYKLANVIKEHASSHFDFEAFWEQSLMMAVLAREIARHRKSPQVEEAFLVGLLQNIGVVVLSGQREAEYQQVLARKKADTQSTLVAIEQELLGIDHARLGGEAAKSWKLPEELCQAIHLHHQRPTLGADGKMPAELIQLSYAAGLMPDFLDGSWVMQILDELENLKLVRGEDFEVILSRAAVAFKAIASFFESFIPADSQLAQLMLDATDRLKQLGQKQQDICAPSW
ncbi:MAG: hypothetical protein HJJLKODD_02134 [Phycisphaerae bacterium]|nr:hypothetical protein [Phycisphaerae bacterium]